MASGGQKPRYPGFQFSKAATDRMSNPQGPVDTNTELLTEILDEVRALRAEVTALRGEIKSVQEVKEVQKRVFPGMQYKQRDCFSN